jgi:phosphoglycerate dehydrogenase-like enzyme
MDPTNLLSNAESFQRHHLRGAALDVYVVEFEHTPRARLWSDPEVLITPVSDHDRHRFVDLFCENLRAYLDGRHSEMSWMRAGLLGRCFLMAKIDRMELW